MRKGSISDLQKMAIRAGVGLSELYAAVSDYRSRATSDLSRPQRIELEGRAAEALNSIGALIMYMSQLLKEQQEGGA